MRQRPDVTPPSAPIDARVCVVIPVKDDAERLTRCLQALAAQTRAPDEIVVVDNGSSDPSAEVAQRAGAVVVACAQPGIPAASARGYDRATGELILRLDADCIPAPNWVETVVASFDRRPDVAAFTGGARFIDGPRLLRTPLALIYLAAYVTASAPALGHLPLFGSNLAMRRDAWRTVTDRVHRDDPEVHDDLDLAFHLGLRHRIRPLPRSSTGSSMGMSMRPFWSAGGMLRRCLRGFRTVLVHWPRDFPPLRWLRVAVLLRRVAPPTIDRARPRIGRAGRGGSPIRTGPTPRAGATSRAGSLAARGGHR